MTFWFTPPFIDPRLLARMDFGRRALAPAERRRRAKARRAARASRQRNRR